MGVRTVPVLKWLEEISAGHLFTAYGPKRTAKHKNFEHVQLEPINLLGLNGKILPVEPMSSVTIFCHPFTQATGIRVALVTYPNDKNRLGIVWSGGRINNQDKSRETTMQSVRVSTKVPVFD